jgi:hypothetical protein
MQNTFTATNVTTTTAAAVVCWCDIAMMAIC